MLSVESSSVDDDNDEYTLDRSLPIAHIKQTGQRGETMRHGGSSFFVFWVERQSLSEGYRYQKRQREEITGRGREKEREESRGEQSRKVSENEKRKMGVFSFCLHEWYRYRIKDALIARRGQRAKMKIIVSHYLSYTPPTGGP